MTAIARITLLSMVLGLSACAVQQPRAHTAAANPAFATEYQAGSADGTEQTEYPGQTLQADATHLRQLRPATGGQQPLGRETRCLRSR